MRTVLFALLTLVVVFPTNAADPASSVFTHECRTANAKKMGFECRLNEAGMEIYWREDLDKMAADRREKVTHEADRLVLRYFDLGWRTFTVRMAHWQSDKMRICSRTRDTNSFTCGDCTWKNGECGTH